MRPIRPLRATTRAAPTQPGQSFTWGDWTRCARSLMACPPGCAGSCPPTAWSGGVGYRQSLQGVSVSCHGATPCAHSGAVYYGGASQLAQVGVALKEGLHSGNARANRGSRHLQNDRFTRERYLVPEALRLQAALVPYRRRLAKILYAKGLACPLALLFRHRPRLPPLHQATVGSAVPPDFRTLIVSSWCVNIADIALYSLCVAVRKTLSIA